MKKLFAIGLMLTAFSSATVMAAALPDCWTESGMDVEDGSFIVQLETEQMSKAELLGALDKLNGANLNAPNFPLVFDDVLIVTVEAVDYGVGEYRLSREELKAAVNAELSLLLALPGVSAFCNGRVYPAAGLAN